MIHRIEYLIKHNTFVQKAYVILMSIGFRFLGLFIRPNKRQVMFQSLIGKTYGDSPKILFDRMKADPDFAGYRFVWAFADPDKFQVEGARKVKLNSLGYFIETMRSGIWITNVDMQRGLHYKSKKILSINTWHGVPMKVIGNAQKTRNDYNYYDVDLLCCSCPFEREVFIRDFNVPADAVVQCGMPRNDELYRVTAEDRARYRKELGIPEDKKVILYCPTWRDSADGGNSYQIAPPIDVEYWQRELGSEYVMLFRMHHLTTEMLGIEYNDFARDVSDAPQINHLMAAADILVSDYSATIFDFSILEKPIISFAYDYEDYSHSRGFYEKLDDVLPGSHFATQEEVVKHIQTMDYAAECEKTKKVKNKYIAAAGNATETCMAFIKDRLKK